MPSRRGASRGLRQDLVDGPATARRWGATFGVRFRSVQRRDYLGAFVFTEVGRDGVADAVAVRRGARVTALPTRIDGFVADDAALAAKPIAHRQPRCRTWMRPPPAGRDIQRVKR